MPKKKASKRSGGAKRKPSMKSVRSYYVKQEIHDRLRKMADAHNVSIGTILTLAADVLEEPGELERRLKARWPMGDHPIVSKKKERERAAAKK